MLYCQYICYNSSNMKTLESIEKSLKSLGLARDSAAVYSTLLEFGPQKASDIVRKTHISRPLVYRALDDLEEQKLVSNSQKSGNITIFAAEDPRQLRSNLETKIEDMQQNKSLLDSLLPIFISKFANNSDKPSFRYIDTLEGFTNLFHESNRCKSTIYQFCDPAVMEDPRFVEITKNIADERLLLGTHKVFFYPDTELARSWLTLYPDFEQYICKGFPTSNTIILSFDNVTALIVIEKDRIVGYSIYDYNLSNLLKTILVQLWGVSEKQTPDHLTPTDLLSGQSV
jgi:predicted DNA-binding transcriptional regulator